MEVEEYKIDIRKCFTNLNSMRTLLNMARIKDIVSGLQNQTSRDCEELSQANEELDKLRNSYQRFRDLSALVQAKESRVKIAAAMLANVSLRDFNEDCDPISRKLEVSVPEAAGIVFDKESLNLSKFSLWRVIREIVRQSAEIRVYELEEQLKSFGIKTSRAAIESAIATHPREFSTRKHGREKYVSLKGA